MNQLAKVGQARIYEFDKFEDHRGAFSEIFRMGWFSVKGVTFTPMQVNVSRTKGNCLRGLHQHYIQSDIWHFVSGNAYVALHDPDTKETWEGAVSSDNIIFIPKGILHGFYVPEMDYAVLMYLTDQYYNPNDEYAFKYDDPGLNLHWPIPRKSFPILSNRDQMACKYYR